MTEPAQLQTMMVLMSSKLHMTVISNGNEAGHANWEEAGHVHIL